MSKLITKAKIQLLLWWSVIFYIGLFTINSLGTAVIGSITGKVWGNLTTTDKVVIIVGIIVQWSTTMLAFLNSAIDRIKKVETEPDTKDPIISEIQDELEAEEKENKVTTNTVTNVTTTTDIK